MVVQDVCAPRGLVEAPDDVHHGRFPRSRNAHHRDKFALANRQRNSAQRMHFDIAHLVNFMNVIQLNDRLDQCAFVRRLRFYLSFRFNCFGISLCYQMHVLASILNLSEPTSEKLRSVTWRGYGTNRNIGSISFRLFRSLSSPPLPWSAAGATKTATTRPSAESRRALGALRSGIAGDILANDDHLAFFQITFDHF